MTFFVDESCPPSFAEVRCDIPSTLRQRYLVLDILNLNPLSSLSLPHATCSDRAESEKNAKGNAQSPNSLHLIADGLACANPGEVVVFGHVRAHAGDERTSEGRIGLAAQGCTVEVRKRLASGDGNNHDSDEEDRVTTKGNEERQLCVVVEDISDGDIEYGYAGLKSRLVLLVANTAS
jgi:hypothetical protein